MPKTLEIQAYTFQELTPQARQEVITRLAPEDNWWEHIYEDAKEQGKELGFQIEVIYFSGFYSQGDGASWSGAVDVITWLEKNKKDDPKAQILIELVEDGWINKRLCISTNWRYSHAGSMTYDDFEMVEPMENSVVSRGILKDAPVEGLIEATRDMLEALPEDILESAKDYAWEIFKNLRNEYEYLCSEECITELCDANEYLFSKDGKHFV